MSALAILVAGALALDVHVGIGPTHEVRTASWQVRGGAGARRGMFRLDVVYERSFRALVTSGEEGCVSTPLEGGCLSMPHLLAGRFTVFPVAWGPVEPIVFATAGWASRSIKAHAGDTHDDLALGGGFGAEVGVRPFYGSLWLRALRYATYHPRYFGSGDWSLGVGLDAGIRF